MQEVKLKARISEGATIEFLEPLPDLPPGEVEIVVLYPEAESSRETKHLGIADLLAAHREAILRLAEKHGAYNVRVFGSVARGEATDTSDVDFLVEWDYTRLSSWGGIGLYLELEELLGRKVDISTEETLHWRIREQVLEEAVPL
jgi:uncharacterized protein